jgi:hypothetical protein
MSADATSPVEFIDARDPDLLRAAILRAVDFRGDVTVRLADGREIVGFAFDARLEPVAELRVLRADSNDRVRIPLAEIRALGFTGKDAASGKSWENWVRRYAEKKLAGEAASIESEAL